MYNSSKSIKEISKLRLTLMVVALGIAYFFSNFHRLSLGIIGNAMATDFNLTSTQLGLLGSAFFYAYAVMQIPSGIIVDKLGAKLVITISCVLTAISTFIFSLTPNFTGLIIARGITGFAVAFVYVPALTALRQWFDDKVLGTMTGILVAMGQLGSVFASVPLKLATDAFGWRSTFRIISYISLVLSLLVWFNVINKNKKENKISVSKNINKYKIILNPGFIAIAVWFFIAGGTRLAFQSLWGSQYFTQVLESSAEMSSVLLMLISIGCIFGAMIFGSLADKYGSIKTLIVSSIILTAIWFVMILFTSKTPNFILGFICLLLGLIGAGGFTVAFTCIREFSDKSNTGLLTGINNCSAFLGSAIITQLSGVLVGSMQNLTLSTKYMLLLGGFGFICFIMTVCIAFFNRGASHLS